MTRANQIADTYFQICLVFGRSIKEELTSSAIFFWQQRFNLTKFYWVFFFDIFISKIFSCLKVSYISQFQFRRTKLLFGTLFFCTFFDLIHWRNSSLAEIFDISRLTLLFTNSNFAAFCNIKLLATTQLFISKKKLSTLLHITS